MKVLTLLETNPKRKFGVDEIARRCQLSLSVLRNELPKLAEEGYVCRKMDGRTYVYFNQKLKPIANEPVVPITPAGLFDLLRTAAQDNYEPVVAKLAWKLPVVIGEVANAAMTGNTASLTTARMALLELLKAVERYADVLRRTLGTVELWDERVTQWAVTGASEKNLEEFGQLTRQALDNHGRLEPSKQGTNQTTD